MEAKLTPDQWQEIVTRFKRHQIQKMPDSKNKRDRILEHIADKALHLDSDYFALLLEEYIRSYQFPKDELIELIRLLITDYEEVTRRELASKIPLPPIGYKFDDQKVRINFMRNEILAHRMNRDSERINWTDYFVDKLMRSQRTIDGDLSLARVNPKLSSRHVLGFSVNLTEACILIELLYNNIAHEPVYSEALIEKVWFSLIRSPHAKQRILQNFSGTELSTYLNTLEKSSDTFQTETDMLKRNCLKLPDRENWYQIQPQKIRWLIRRYYKIGFYGNQVELSLTSGEHYRGKIADLGRGSLFIRLEGQDNQEIMLSDITTFNIELSER